MTLFSESTTIILDPLRKTTQVANPDGTLREVIHFRFQNPLPLAESLYHIVLPHLITLIAITLGASPFLRGLHAPGDPVDVKGFRFQVSGCGRKPLSFPEGALFMFYPCLSVSHSVFCL
jgi:hypothetical protein